ncbi:cation:proton antiporter, partial [Francisella tularensis subsp. holarctica]|uniref:cation:proton antiporter domain-containing protein n=1 Tax=Francisella tularensis TaxID=263 RepID=UPI002381ABE9
FFVMLGILVVTIVIKKLKQPYVVAYLLTGILLGQYGLRLIQDQENLERLGEIGVILLLFFAGMEVSPRKFADNWHVPTIGT